MDPNETLKRLRLLLSTGYHARKLFSKETTYQQGLFDHILECEELFQALDQWLSKGGFLPTSWRPNSASADNLEAPST